MKIIMYEVDWKENIHLPTLNEAIRMVFDGEHPPVIAEVLNTGGDFFCYVISAEPLTRVQVEEEFTKYLVEDGDYHELVAFFANWETEDSPEFIDLLDREIKELAQEESELLKEKEIK